MTVVRHLSASQYSMWEGCAEQWRRRYLLGERIPPGIAALTGTGVHASTELNFEQKVTTHEDMPLSDLKDAARDAYWHEAEKQGVFVPRDELPGAKGQIADGLDEAVRLVDPLREQFLPQIQPYLYEQRMILKEDDLPDIVCYPDVLSTDWRLSDLKTTKRKWPDGKVQASHQPTLYREAVFRETGHYPRFITIDQIVKTKVPKYEFAVADRCDEDYQTLLRRFRLMVASCETGLFAPAEPSHWRCSPRFCGYYYTCKFIPPHRRVLPKRSV